VEVEEPAVAALISHRTRENRVRNRLLGGGAAATIPARC